MYELKSFKRELSALINRYGLESECGNTPDYILADVALTAIKNFGRFTTNREIYFTKPEQESYDAR